MTVWKATGKGKLTHVREGSRERALGRIHGRGRDVKSWEQLSGSGAEILHFGLLRLVVEVNFLELRDEGLDDLFGRLGVGGVRHRRRDVGEPERGDKSIRVR